jgi:hypothetical protein
LEQDDLMLVRVRIKMIRRTAIEASRHLTGVPTDHPKAGEIAQMNRACRAVIAVTRPSVVSKATFPECMAVLAFTVAATAGTRTKLN